MILLISPKDVYATKRFIEEAEKAKVKLDVFDIEDLAKQNFKINFIKYNIIFFRQSYPYEKEVFHLAKEFIKYGKKIINQPSTLADVIAGKWRNHQKLKESGLLLPKSFLLSSKNNFKSHILNSKFYILKWIYGLKGREVFLVKDAQQLETITKKFPKKELMAQEFLRADYEYKVITVGYKSASVVLKFKTQDSGFRVDFKNYQTLNNKDVPAVCKLAEKASKILKYELAKVDILEKRGEFYILEVNRSPGLKSFESLTKFNVAKEFIKYLKV